MQSSYFTPFLPPRRLCKSNLRQTLIPIMVLLFVVCLGVIVFAALTLNRITPFFSQPGDVVTITGSGFSTDPAQNIVRFGPNRAAVLSATSSQLVVQVPNGQPLGPTNVTVTSGTPSPESVTDVADE